MEKAPNFNALIEKSIKENWNLDALTDYKGITLQYHDVARKIEKLHIMFENSGVVRGDKIALCGRNSAGWAAAAMIVIGARFETNMARTCCIPNGIAFVMGTLPSRR